MRGRHLLPVVLVAALLALAPALLPVPSASRADSEEREEVRAGGEDRFQVPATVPPTQFVEAATGAGTGGTGKVDAVAVDSAPTEADGSLPFQVCWKVWGSGTISATTLRTSETSKAGSSNPRDYAGTAYRPNNAQSDQPYPVSSSGTLFCANVLMPSGKDLFLRPFAQGDKGEVPGPEVKVKLRTSVAATTTSTTSTAMTSTGTVTGVQFLNPVRSAPAGGKAVLCYEVKGSGTIPRTAVRAALTTAPFAETEAAYPLGPWWPDNGTRKDVTLPGTFCTAVDMGGTTLYVRALADGAVGTVLSPEHAIAVVLTSPPPASGATVSSIQITRAPSAALASAPVLVCWNLKGSGTVPDTRLLTDLVPHPVVVSRTDYLGANYFPENASAPAPVTLSGERRLCTNVQMPAAGILFLRAYAVSSTGEVYSAEAAISATLDTAKVEAALQRIRGVVTETLTGVLGKLDLSRIPAVLVETERPGETVRRFVAVPGTPGTLDVDNTPGADLTLSVLPTPNGGRILVVPTNPNSPVTGVRISVLIASEGSPLAVCGGMTKFSMIGYRVPAGAPVPTFFDVWVDQVGSGGKGEDALFVNVTAQRAPQGMALVGGTWRGPSSPFPAVTVPPAEVKAVSACGRGANMEGSLEVDAALRLPGQAEIQVPPGGLALAIRTKSVGAEETVAVEWTAGEVFALDARILADNRTEKVGSSTWIQADAMPTHVPWVRLITNPAAQRTSIQYAANAEIPDLRVHMQNWTTSASIVHSHKWINVTNLPREVGLDLVGVGRIELSAGRSFDKVEVGLHDRRPASRTAAQVWNLPAKVTLDLRDPERVHLRADAPLARLDVWSLNRKDGCAETRLHVPVAPEPFQARSGCTLTAAELTLIPKELDLYIGPKGKLLDWRADTEVARLRVHSDSRATGGDRIDARIRQFPTRFRLDMRDEGVIRVNATRPFTDLWLDTWSPGCSVLILEVPAPPTDPSPTPGCSSTFVSAPEIPKNLTFHRHAASKLLQWEAVTSIPTLRVVTDGTGPKAARIEAIVTPFPTFLRLDTRQADRVDLDAPAAFTDLDLRIHQRGTPCSVLDLVVPALNRAASQVAGCSYTAVTASSIPRNLTFENPDESKLLVWRAVDSVAQLTVRSDGVGPDAAFVNVTVAPLPPDLRLDTRKPDVVDLNATNPFTRLSLRVDQHGKDCAVIEVEVPIGPFPGQSRPTCPYITVGLSSVPSRFVLQTPDRGKLIDWGADAEVARLEARVVDTLPHRNTVDVLIQPLRKQVRLDTRTKDRIEFTASDTLVNLTARIEENGKLCRRIAIDVPVPPQLAAARPGCDLVALTVTGIPKTLTFDARSGIHYRAASTIPVARVHLIQDTNHTNLRVEPIPREVDLTTAKGPDRVDYKASEQVTVFRFDRRNLTDLVHLEVDDLPHEIHFLNQEKRAVHLLALAGHGDLGYIKAIRAYIGELPSGSMDIPQGPGNQVDIRPGAVRLHVVNLAQACWEQAIRFEICPPKSTKPDLHFGSTTLGRSLLHLSGKAGTPLPEPVAVGKVEKDMRVVFRTKDRPTMAFALTSQAVALWVNTTPLPDDLTLTLGARITYSASHPVDDVTVRLHTERPMVFYQNVAPPPLAIEGGVPADMPTLDDFFGGTACDSPVTFDQGGTLMKPEDLVVTLEKLNVLEGDMVHEMGMFGDTRPPGGVGGRPSNVGVSPVVPGKGGLQGGGVCNLSPKGGTTGGFDLLPPKGSVKLGGKTTVGPGETPWLPPGWYPGAATNDLWLTVEKLPSGFELAFDKKGNVTYTAEGPIDRIHLRTEARGRNTSSLELELLDLPSHVSTFLWDKDVTYRAGGVLTSLRLKVDSRAVTKNDVSWLELDLLLKDVPAMVDFRMQGSSVGYQASGRLGEIYLKLASKPLTKKPSWLQVGAADVRSHFQLVNQGGELHFSTKDPTPITNLTVFQSTKRSEPPIVRNADLKKISHVRSVPGELSVFVQSVREASVNFYDRSFSRASTKYVPTMLIDVVDFQGGLDVVVDTESTEVQKDKDGKVVKTWTAGTYLHLSVEKIASSFHFDANDTIYNARGSVEGLALNLCASDPGYEKEAILCGGTGVGLYTARLPDSVSVDVSTDRRTLSASQPVEASFFLVDRKPDSKSPFRMISVRAAVDSGVVVDTTGKGKVDIRTTGTAPINASVVLHHTPTSLPLTTYRNGAHVHVNKTGDMVGLSARAHDLRSFRLCSEKPTLVHTEGEVYPTWVAGCGGAGTLAVYERAGTPTPADNFEFILHNTSQYNSRFQPVRAAVEHDLPQTIRFSISDVQGDKEIRYSASSAILPTAAHPSALRFVMPQSAEAGRGILLVDAARVPSDLRVWLPEKAPGKVVGPSRTVLGNCPSHHAPLPTDKPSHWRQAAMHIYTSEPIEIRDLLILGEDYVRKGKAKWGMLTGHLSVTPDPGTETRFSLYPCSRMERDQFGNLTGTDDSAIGWSVGGGKLDANLARLEREFPYGSDRIEWTGWTTSSTRVATDHKVTVGAAIGLYLLGSTGAQYAFIAEAIGGLYTVPTPDWYYLSLDGREWEYKVNLRFCAYEGGVAIWGLGKNQDHRRGSWAVVSLHAVGPLTVVHSTSIPCFISGESLLDLRPPNKV